MERELEARELDTFGEIEERQGENQQVVPHNFERGADLYSIAPGKDDNAFNEEYSDASGANSAPLSVTTRNYQNARQHRALGANKNRTYLFLQNNSAGTNMRIGFSSANRNNGILVAPGGFYEPNTAPTSDVYVYFDGVATGRSELVIVEGAKG